MLIFQALLRWRSPAVLIEVLVYLGFRWAAEVLRAEVVRVAMDKDGIIPEVRPAAARARDRIDLYVQRAVNILGGYDLAWRRDVPFLWLRLPRGWRAGVFMKAAEAIGVRIRSAEEYANRDARVPMRSALRSMQVCA